MAESNDELVEEVVHYKEMSPARMVMRRFFRSRLSLVGVVMLVALFAFAFIGPPIMQMVGYTWSETETDHTPTIKRATKELDVKTTDAYGNEYAVIQFIEEAYNQHHHFYQVLCSNATRYRCLL